MDHLAALMGVQAAGLADVDEGKSVWILLREVRAGLDTVLRGDRMLPRIALIQLKNS